MSDDDLSKFLLARIAEDERAAREAVPSVTGWSVGLERTADRRGVVAHLVIPDDSVDEIGRASDEVARTRWLTTAAHIARWDPARVLAECAAKRRIVEAARHTLFNDLLRRTDFWRGVCDVVDADLRMLALPYADHPDYDESWRP